ncbi:MAG: two-component regulator propeller domain-containing protein [Bacteroidales bacterium]
MKTLKQTFGNRLKFQIAGNSFMKKIFLGFLIILFAMAGYAQDTQWQIYNTSNSGLPSNYIHAIAMDQNGSKWIGTSNGLVKFDENNWTIYNTSNSGLPSNAINGIVIDGIGTKWIGTWNGLVKFDGTTWITYNTSNSGLPSNQFLTMDVDQNGTVWVGTIFGLTKFDGTNWIHYNTENSGLPLIHVLELSIDVNGTLWIGSHDGFSGWYDNYALSKFDGTNWTTYDSGNSGFPDREVTAITTEEDGLVWFGNYHEGNWGPGYGQLTKFDETYWTHYDSVNSGLPDNQINAIAIESNGSKWIGTENGGLAEFDGTNWTLFNTSNSGLSSERVYCIAIDQNGSKWIGTENGLSVYNENGFTVAVDENMLPRNNSTMIYPNPSQGQITVDLKELSNVSINVYSLNGSRIYHRENITGTQYQFELNADAGIYILEISTPTETQQYKLVKE